ncbi:schlafen family protein [Kipferlia bialata]|uniref:Schlafen family protein n=1 Tax=Kipferlia bialata TaxID=797122 RepID=A0A9K3D074_9EUKA|nr:schlafen family protein [Kipferlia bialata]|eukprot:g7396.t1
MKDEFGDVPSSLVYNSVFSRDEDRVTEFKAVQISKRPIDMMTKLCREYINAYLNSNGGSIWFGIEDDGQVKGILCSRKDRDKIRLNIDAVVNGMAPQVDSALYRVDLIPVTEDKQLNHS